MAAEVEKTRPNIRIQISNNVREESMDVDEPENEEGEIVDDTAEDNEDFTVAKPVQNKGWNSQYFTTGINIFDKEEQGKLQERAKRFALKPEEIHNFTDDDLQQLHWSLGISAENETTARFEAIHLLGVEKFGAEDVLKIFQKYAPISVEWVTNTSCNVIWGDHITTARAMHFESKVVKGMPARGPSDTFPKDFIDDLDLTSELEPTSGKSILLANPNRVVELLDEDDKKIDYSNSVDISEITMPIPPGYWRLSNSQIKSKRVLVRFAFKTDKQPFRTESLAKYFAKAGGQNERKKGIFERNKEMNMEGKNPWGSLARNWNNDRRFCEPEPILIEDSPQKLEIKNPSLLERLGTKRQKEPTPPPSDDEEGAKEASTPPPVEKKKFKLPRMRMYADEEEEKVQRKKLLQTIKKQSEKIEKDDISRSDLRNILATPHSKSQPIKQEIQRAEVAALDLGSKLRNRNKQMTFTIQGPPVEEFRVKQRPDVRALLEERRARSPTRGRFHNRTRRSSRDSTLHSDRIMEKRIQQRRSRTPEDESYSGKTRSKVAVVIKTQKKPTVASTVWSRVNRPQASSSSSSESSEEELSQSESSEEEGQASPKLRMERPGFKRDIRTRLSGKLGNSNPLKIQINNDY